MRQSWRLLLFRNYHRSSSQFSTQPLHHFQAISSSALVPSLSSFQSLSGVFLGERINPGIPFARNFSSEPLVESNKEPDHHAVISDIFVRCSGASDIERELESSGVVISHDVVLKVLKSLDSSPDVAQRFFDWVMERDRKRLSSKAYNLMLGILGVNGYVEKFWTLVGTMKGQGFGVSKGIRDKVMEKFEKDGLSSDAERLKAVFASGSTDDSEEKIGLRMSRIVRNQAWSEQVEIQLRDLNVPFSTDLVKIVLENLAMEPSKALMFFRWLEESELVKHDERTYNAIARVLGREDCIDLFWKVVQEIRSNGYEMEEETYVKVLGRFMKRRMRKEAVDLYEFAMGGANKPSVHCCTFLLRKIVVGKDLDMGLFSRVIGIFTGNGNMLTDSMLDSILKSLRSVGRFGECNKILKEMKEGGFSPGSTLQSKIVLNLSSAGKKEEVGEFVNHIETSGNALDFKAWASLVEGNCASGDLEKASTYFQEMLGKEGVSRVGYVFEMLVNAYCRKNRAIDACKLLRDCVSEHEFKPLHTTYKSLISKLLVQGGFKDALSLLDLMKNHGFPPFVNPFVEYVSKSGTSNDAIAFMEAMTSKKFPSTSVVLRVFDALFKAKRHNVAQNLLPKCPAYIRNHADVLSLFYTMKSGKDNVATMSSV
ncbi:hypothetical protein K2173_020064 [Erythroxylum novogranatense]|uniref:Pentatricopeptide repeat-containing protein n=1 Tax=Erythroxylum novogranatense TaxID=1862640 RepID=A0AAV8U703_9ROSI|nr:hypothetical protein K2173_020064 [Erythroxylum novogranatense]